MLCYYYVRQIDTCHPLIQIAEKEGEGSLLFGILPKPLRRAFGCVMCRCFLQSMSLLYGLTLERRLNESHRKLL